MVKQRDGRDAGLGGSGATPRRGQRSGDAAIGDDAEIFDYAGSGEDRDTPLARGPEALTDAGLSNWAVLEYTFDILPDGLLVLDASGRMVAWNKSFVDLANASSRTPRIGAPLASLARQWEMSGWRNHEGGRRFDESLTAHCVSPCDGPRIRLSSPAGRVYETRASRVPGGSITLFADISGEISAIKDAFTADARLVGAMQAVGDGLLIFDPDDRLILANTRFAEIAPEMVRNYEPGMRFEELIGASAREGFFSLVDEPDLTTPDQLVARRMQLHRDAPSEHEQRFSNDRWVHVSTRPTGDGGRAVSYTDITRRVRAEAKARRLNEELEARVRQRTAELEKANRRLTELATTDSLTGALNRRRFRDEGGRELIRSKRYEEPLAVAMIDIDRFKSVNDTYGHAAGDKALKALSLHCRQTLRTIDMFGRLGGEEFAAVLPNTGIEGARDVAERLRVGLAGLEIVDGDNTFSFTVSIGLAVLTGSDDLDSLLARADRALYEAKSTGRDRVCVA